jgi:hypothetical protein
MAEGAASAAKSKLLAPFSGLKGSHKIIGALGLLAVILVAFRFRNQIMGFLGGLPVVGGVANKIAGAA